MWDIRQMIRSAIRAAKQRNPAMALLAGGRNLARRGRGGPVLHALFFIALAAIAVAAIVHLLAPRWDEAQAPLDAPRLPIVVAGVVFNIAPAAIRVPLQRRAGLQERLDLAYAWPDLTPPDSRAAGSAARLFVTIEAAQSALLPSERLKSIYPRYAEAAAPGPNGLAMLAFRDGTPYQGEDLLYDPALPDRFMVRCNRSRDELTMAMCLFERPYAAAALTFRFPRDWLADWPAVLGGTERLIAGWQPAGR
jgi:hypothetical protein